MPQVNTCARDAQVGRHSDGERERGQASSQAPRPAATSIQGLGAGDANWGTDWRRAVPTSGQATARLSPMRSLDFTASHTTSLLPTGGWPASKNTSRGTQRVIRSGA